MHSVLTQVYKYAMIQMGQQSHAVTSHKSVSEFNAKSVRKTKDDFSHTYKMYDILPQSLPRESSSSLWRRLNNLGTKGTVLHAQ